MGGGGEEREMLTFYNVSEATIGLESCRGLTSTSRCKLQMLDESQMLIPTTGVYTKKTVFIVTAGLPEQKALN